MRTVLLLSLMVVWLAANCGGSPQAAVEISHYPLDGLDGVITRTGVMIDSIDSADGGGSLRVETGDTTTVRLFETGDIDIEDARLIYRARIRTEDVQGRAYLEMWCQFPGQGEYFSRGLEAPLSGTNDWSTQEISFFLEAGQNPDNVKLNLVIEGSGTVWIDDVRLLGGSLR